MTSKKPKAAARPKKKAATKAGSEPAADAQRSEDDKPRYHGQTWEAAERDAESPRPTGQDDQSEAAADEAERNEQRELQRERDGGHTRPPESVGR
jgi:hypothetical protein